MTIITDIAPIGACDELYQGDEERILCINPDATGWKLESDDYRRIPHLKGILCSVTSLSWLDMTYAHANDIPVCNIRNYATQAVAEWVVLTLLALARKLPLLIKHGFQLDYGNDFQTYQGIELQGKIVGIIGLGDVGSAVANRLAGLGMDVWYWSRSPKECPYKSVTLQQILREADVIIPALALNQETTGFINNERLAVMKKEAIFISIDELYSDALFPLQAVLKMVKDGSLYGFGFEALPASFNSYKGNVWAAPAYAWNTDASHHNTITAWVADMVKAAHGEFPHRVQPGQTT